MGRTLALALCVFSAFVAGCGKSPLFNHADADVLSQNIDQLASGTPKKPALDFPLSGFNASIEWDSTPMLRADMYFTLRFWNKASATMKGPYSNPPRAVGVLPWMGSMGHGTSPTEITQIADGVYRVKVYFIMRGNWEIHIQQLDGANVFEEAIENVEVL